MKYLTVIILIHSLLTVAMCWTKTVAEFCRGVERILRKKRKIPVLRFRSMKLFYEMLFSGVFRLREVIAEGVAAEVLCVEG